MTLAVVVSFLAFFCTPAVLGTTPNWAQSAAQEPASAKTADSPSQPDKDSSKPQNQQSATQTPSDQNKPAVKTGTHKVKKKKIKKAVAAKCADAAPAGSNPLPPSSSAGGTGSATAPSSSCPPPITVVHDGGAADPAIKLTGSTEGAQPSAKHAPDQLVVSTEENLKKVEGRELNPSQKEMLTQIHQFLEQSKAATAAGDIDRGHTLAMKAHLLSDELTKP
jgi:hypothetical protein